MAAGITIYNDNNILQIDGNFKNLHLSRKIAITKTGSFSGSFADGEVLAAVGGTTSQTINAYCINRPGGWTCVVNGYTSGMAVYVFTTKPTQSVSGVGLQVFDENGNIVYDSNDKHPLVKGFGSREGVPSQATKPAIAVCVSRKHEYTEIITDRNYTSYYESWQEWVPAQYGWVDVEKTRSKYVDPVYGWTTGYYEYVTTPGHYENQWIPGGYEYNWQTNQYEYTSGHYESVWVPSKTEAIWHGPEYVKLSDGYWTTETYTEREYKVVEEAHYATISGWRYYWETYETLVYTWLEENFMLSSGNIVNATVSSGQSRVDGPKLVEKRAADVVAGGYEEYHGSYFREKGIIVDTRSWLLLDVNGL